MASPSNFLSQIAELSSSTASGILAISNGVVSVEIETPFNISNYALLNSPTFTGTPAAPTPSINDNSTNIATTAFVQTTLANYATVASVTSAIAAIPTAQIQTIGASVGANALTVTLAPTILSFRSPILNNGTITNVTIPSTLSLTVPTGATLGSIAGQSTLFGIIALWNGSVVSLGIVNIAGSGAILGSSLLSTTAISASSTSASVVYSSSAFTNVPYQLVGYISITEAVAGTWVTPPSLVQGAGGLASTQFGSIGVGQTWQNFANAVSGRQIGTVYYNTTGKPIQIAVATMSGVATTAAASYGYVNGTLVSAGYASNNVGTDQNTQFHYLIVPSGNSYQITGEGFYIWSELR